MLSKTKLCMLTVQMVSVLAAPPRGKLEERRNLVGRSERYTACFTKHVEPITDAARTTCNYGAAEVASFQEPYISIPEAIFTKGYTGTDPNKNPICGKLVRITNLNVPGKTIMGRVMDSK